MNLVNKLTFNVNHFIKYNLYIHKSQLLRSFNFFQYAIFPFGSQSHSLYYTVISQKSTSKTKVFNGNAYKGFY